MLERREGRNEEDYLVYLFLCGEGEIMSEAKSILSILLFALQLCLGFWQIVKLTLVGAFVHGFLSSRMGMLPCGLGSRLSPTYARLKKFESDSSSILKIVRSCCVIQPSDEPNLSRQIADETPDKINSSYLGEIIDLERRGKNKLFKDGKMAYYITDAIWYTLLDMGRLASMQTVFLKGHKKISETNRVTGGVMDLSEVLDSLILENHVIKPLENTEFLLPINLSVSEEKILKALNLAGLFLQTKKHGYWLIPILFSFTAAVLEFSTPLRQWLYSKINAMFNCALHLICDRLPHNMRFLVFYNVHLYLVELDPFNDIECKVMRGDMCAVIGGGAKCHNEHATLVQPDPDRLRHGETQGSVNFDFGPFKASLTFNPTEGKCHVKPFFRGYLESIVLNCNRNEYGKLIAFVSNCMGKHRCGSMKSCSSNNHRVRVRWFEESIIQYAKSGFPDVYELKLKNVVIM